MLTRLPLLILCGWLKAYSASADHLLDEGLWELSPEQLGNIRVVTIASGTPTPLGKAPAITAVITAEDIRSMAATDLNEVLETVPGIHVSPSPLAYAPRYIIRGIASANNPQTLVLINGIPVTNLVFGNRGNAWGGMPLKSIERIEVIRGPGSALYGADAFAGVINITTKGPEQIKGLTTGGGVGSFDTQEVWLQYGQQLEEAAYSFSVEYLTTDGWREQIDSDSQTIVDDAFSTDASLAPGPVNVMVDSLDLRFEAQVGSLTLRAGYQGRYDLGTGPGLAEALDPSGRFASRRYNMDVTYVFNDILENFSTIAQFSYFQDTQEVEENVLLFPPGALGGTFPDGFIGNPEFKEEIVRLNISSLYTGVHNHLFRFGFGGYWGDVFEVKETRNFILSDSGGFVPRENGLEKVDDTPEVWLPEKDRTSGFIYVQDEWQLGDHWQLTSGLRYDYYSDFGKTVNPRLALVWATTDSLTAKLLYGRAFRAPSIQELFAFSNPVALGNKELEPEQIDTVELGISYQPNTKLRSAASIFYYEIDDLIDFSSFQAENNGQRRGKGFELELDYSLDEFFRLISHYSYQESEEKIKRAQMDRDTSYHPVGQAPNHQAYIRTEFDLSESDKLSFELTWIGEQKRSHGDPRSKPTPSYTTFDIRYDHRRFLGHWNLSLQAKNVFDEDVREPSSADPTMASVNIENDFPMAGRSFLVELSYEYQ